ncbi:MAG TPA: hypothetical protein VLI06_07990 [Solimonas sp.]|nr:hypothetical protein [Solimonas sp.]
MRLHQINARYEAVQDRVLLRFSTQDAMEYQLWLTRRIVAQLWPGLVQLLQAGGTVGGQPSIESQRALLEFQHQDALAKSDFSKPFAPDGLTQALPEPLLVFSVRMRRRDAKRCSLEFSPQTGASLQIELPDRMVHALVKLIAQAVKKAEWGIAIPAEAPAVAAPAQRRLN